MLQILRKSIQNFHSLLESVHIESSLCRLNRKTTFGIAQFVTQSNVMERKQFERLPTNVVPHNYRLRLQPDLEKFTFAGHVEIELNVKEATSKILLNSAELKLETPTFIGADGNGPEIKASGVSINSEDEIATIEFAENLPIGAGRLQIKFDGILDDKMRGFYRVAEPSADGLTKRYSATTQFEPIDARRSFPCWDEPAIKATFDISIEARPSKSEHFVVLSNMPVRQISDVGEHGLKRYDFARTPIMSTYLVAYIVGEYEFLEAESEDGVLCRVYTGVGKKDQGAYALNVCTKVLPYYKRYFDIAYPLPKMDLIAILDFCSGAMENWGLVTYRERLLLVDEKNTSLMSRQYIALVVGHEIAHQWFGNLVTMEWWTHLWLNEGYASFVEFLCVDHIFPEYNIWEQFVTEMFVPALEADSLENSHPIEVPVHHPADIDEIFDNISYNKGASVIRMLHDMIGEENFRKGMHLYLKRFEYQNTCTEDLWQALSECCDIDVNGVMSSWTKQMGYPIVNVSRRQDGTNTILTVCQEKYATVDKPIGADQLWSIPLNIQIGNDSRIIKKIVSQKSNEIVLENCMENDTILLNPGMVGFYRTKYSPEMQTMLKQQIANGQLKPLDRLCLVTDMYAMINAKKASVVEFLQLLDSFKNETNYNVWLTILSSLSKIVKVFDSSDCYEDFRKFGLNLVSEIAKKIEWDVKENESHFETLLRPLMLQFLVKSGHAETIRVAREMFADYIAGRREIVADLRTTCYMAALQTCTMDEYKAILDFYRKCTSTDERKRIETCLGCIQNKEILSKVLELSISDEVRSQDTVFVIRTAAESRYGRELAWTFFRHNFDFFKTRYECSNLFPRLVQIVTTNLASDDQLRQIEEFFGAHKALGIDRSIKLSIENVKLNINLIERDLPSIKTFFQSI